MTPMPVEATMSEPSPYRVTLFYGPERVEGKSSTSTCVFNVKKRSWKGGIQIAVEITDRQIETGLNVTGFRDWIANALLSLPADERVSLSERANELFVQAVCWCKLDLLLQTGLTQDNQCLTSDTAATELLDVVRRSADFITSYVASELDLVSRDTAN